MGEGRRGGRIPVKYPREDLIVRHDYKVLRNKAPTEGFTPKMGCGGDLFPTRAAGQRELHYHRCQVALS